MVEVNAAEAALRLIAHHLALELCHTAVSVERALSTGLELRRLRAEHST